MNRSIVTLGLQLACGLLLSLPGLARAEASPLPVTQLADRVYLFGGMQSNSLAVVGETGALLVDSGQTPEAGEQLAAAIATVTPQPVRMLVNTHWHFDHVNGNGVFAAKGATVIGHAAMRARAATQPVRAGQPLAAAELPVITDTTGLTLHVADQEIRLVHPRSGKAHTDGDTIVVLPKANIVHMGDLYFVGVYPYIDAGAGGSAAAMATAIREVLPLMNEQTKVVPGHGPVTNKAELATFAAMLDDVSQKVTSMIEDGKTLEQIQQAKPTAAYDERWGRSFFTPEQFVSFVHAGIQQPQAK
jgi:glyoxylase-like metal-dependent hydrolase (beta-lactamase superfamily II)